MKKFSDSLYDGFFVTLRTMNKLYYINNCGGSSGVIYGPGASGTALWVAAPEI